MSDLNKRIVDAYGNPIKLENKITKTTIECKNSTWVRLAQMSCSDNFGQGLFRLSCYMDINGKAVPLISCQLAVSLLASDDWGIKSSINVLSKTDNLRDLNGSDSASSSNIFFSGSLPTYVVSDYMSGSGSDEARVLFNLHKLFIKNGIFKETLPTHIPTLKDYFDGSKLVEYSSSGKNYYTSALPYLTSSPAPNSNSAPYGIGFGYIRTVIEDNTCYLEGLFQAPEIESFSSFIVDIEDISSSGMQILNTVQVADDILSLNNNIIEGMDITKKNNVIVVDFTPQVTISKVKEVALNDRTETLPSIPVEYFNEDHKEDLAALFSDWDWFQTRSIGYDYIEKEITVRRDHEYNLEFNLGEDEENTNILTTYYFTFNKAKYIKNTETNTFDFVEWVGEPTFREISDLSEVREDLLEPDVEKRELARFLTALTAYKQEANIAFTFDYNFNPLGSFNDIGRNLPYLKYCKLNNCHIKIKDNLNSENPLNYMNVYLNGNLVNTTEFTVQEKDNIVFEVKEYPENCAEGKHNITWEDLLKFKELEGMYGSGLFRLTENLISPSLICLDGNSIWGDTEHYLTLDAKINRNCFVQYDASSTYIKYQKTVTVQEPIIDSDDSSDDTPEMQTVEKVVNYWVRLDDQYVFWDKANKKFGTYYTHTYDELPAGSGMTEVTIDEITEPMLATMLKMVLSVSSLLLILKDDIENDDHTQFNEYFTGIEIDNANYFPIIEYDLYSGNMTYAFQFNKTGVLNSFVNTYPDYIQFHLANIRKPDVIAYGVKI